MTKENLKEDIKLFLIGAVVTFLGNLNIYHVQNSIYIGIAILGFVIPLLVTFALKGLVFGDLKDKIVYSLGVSIGGVLGVLFAHKIYQ